MRQKLKGVAGRTLHPGPPNATLTITMDVSAQHARRLAELAKVTPCARDHDCLASDPESLCKATIASDGHAVLCLDEDGWKCRYSVPFGQGTACACLVRQYIAKHLSRVATGA